MNDRPGLFQRILGELRQRHVLRVAGLYIVSGWAVFQVVNSLFPALHLPTWSVTLVAALFLVGLPIVVVVAYAFERTPDGIRRAAPSDPEIAPPRPGWFDWTLLCASVAILGLLAIQFARTDHGAQAKVAGESNAAPAAAVGAAPSIAVLPFVNFSSVVDDEYFADGLTEEMINSLAQLPDLKVAGRTSAFYFKGRNEDLREIGRKLGVAHVLEGSVRRSGDRLRITAQLIKVEDGFHLWSQTYDRTMSDAFVIQQQIAETVAQVLQGHLLTPVQANPLPDDPAGPAKARDPRGYQIELVARSRLRKHEVHEVQAARELYQELIRLEPDNPRAYAGFADASMRLAQDFLALDFDTARQESEAAVQRALELDPQSPDAWRVKGIIDHVISIRTSEQRYSEQALAAMRKAVELDPDNVDSLEMLANLLSSGGQSEQAIAILQRVLAIDPFSRLGQQLLGSTLVTQGRFAEARRQYESLIELYPDFTSAKVALAHLLQRQGRLDEAVRRLDDEALKRDDPISALMLANCYANLGMVDEMTLTAEAIREPPVAAALAHAVLLMRGGQYSALTAFAAEQLAETRDPLWTNVGIVTHVVAGNAPAARALLATATPGLLENPPAADEYQPIDNLLAAYALRETGSREQATAIANAVLAMHEAPPGEYVLTEVRWIRALAFGLLDRVDESIAELRAAKEDGFRTLIDFEYFVRLEDYPFMATVARDPRFAALVEEIEADNRRMRDALRAPAAN